MYNNISKQFKIRKIWLVGSVAVYTAFALAVQIIMCLCDIEGNLTDVLGMGVDIVLGMYVFIRLLANFGRVSYIKNLTISFGDTRKSFAGSFLTISFLQYILVIGISLVIQLLGKVLWMLIKGADFPKGSTPYIWYIYILIITLAPLMELFIGLCYDKFGMIAYWVVFGFFMVFFGFASKIGTVMMQYSISYKNIAIVVLALAYIVSTLGDFILTRKISVN